MAADGTERWAAAGDGELLAQQTLRQLVRVALGYRALVALVAVAITAGSTDLPSADTRRLVTVGCVVVLTHVAVITVGPHSGRHYPAMTWVLVGDVAVAGILNLWASWAIIPMGHLYRGYGDPFGAYAIATLALWTGAQGPRVGAWVLAGVMLPLQAAMAAVNGITLHSMDWARLVMRSLWLLTAFVLGHFLVSALRQGAHALAVASERAGRQTQRRETLDALHNLVLQTLVGIDRRSRDPDCDPGAALVEIRSEAHRRAAEMREVLDSDGRGWVGLYAEMGRLVAELDGRGIVTAELVAAGPEPTVESEVARTLVGAVGEALCNAERHAQADRVTVFVESGDGWVRAVVRDDGCGFDEARLTAGYGMAHCIRERVAQAGGSAGLTTSPGQGTTWELRVPTALTSGTVEAATAERSLVERTLATLATLPLSYRALGLVIAGAGLVGSRSLGPIRLRPALSVLGALALAHVGLIAVRRKAPQVLRNRVVVAGDVLVGAGLSLWAGSAMPRGTIFGDNRDPFTIYAQATVALWTGFGSTPLGATLVVAFGVPLQLGAAALNGVPPADVNWLVLAARALWLVAAFFLTHGIVSAARRGGLLLAADRRRAGTEAERAEALGALGQTVLATLDGIARRRPWERDDAGHVLEAVGAAARGQAARVRLMLRSSQVCAMGLEADLDALVAEYEARGGLDPQLVAYDLDPAVGVEAGRALIGCLAEVLAVAEQAGEARRLTVFVESCGNRLRAVVNDPVRRTGEEAALIARYQALNPSLGDALAGAGRVELTIAPGDCAVWEIWIEARGQQDREDTCPSEAP